MLCVGGCYFCTGLVVTQVMELLHEIYVIAVAAGAKIIESIGALFVVNRHARSAVSRVKTGMDHNILPDQCKGQVAIVLKDPGNRHLRDVNSILCVEHSYQLLANSC